MCSAEKLKYSDSERLGFSRYLKPCRYHNKNKIQNQTTTKSTARSYCYDSLSLTPKVRVNLLHTHPFATNVSKYNKIANIAN